MAVPGVRRRSRPNSQSLDSLAPTCFGLSAYPSMSLASLRLHSPTTAAKLSRAFGSSAANSRRQNLFERSAKCGGEFCFFLVRVRCRTDSLRRACLCDIFFRKKNRKHLQTARPKCACATEQVKSAHSPEAVAVVAQLDFHVQSATPTLRVTALLL